MSKPRRPSPTLRFLLIRTGHCPGPPEYDRSRPFERHSPLLPATSRLSASRERPSQSGPPKWGYAWRRPAAPERNLSRFQSCRSSHHLLGGNLVGGNLVFFNLLDGDRRF